MASSRKVIPPCLCVEQGDAQVRSSHPDDEPGNPPRPPPGRGQAPSGQRTASTKRWAWVMWSSTGPGPRAPRARARSRTAVSSCRRASMAAQCPLPADLSNAAAGSGGAVGARAPRNVVVPRETRRESLTWPSGGARMAASLLPPRGGGWSGAGSTGGSLRSRVVYGTPGRTDHPVRRRTRAGRWHLVTAAPEPQHAAGPAHRGHRARHADLA